MAALLIFLLDDVLVVSPRLSPVIERIRSCLVPLIPSCVSEHSLAPSSFDKRDASGAQSCLRISDLSFFCSAALILVRFLGVDAIVVVHSSAFAVW